MRRKEGGERVRTGKEKKKETKPAQSGDKGNPERERERERERRGGGGVLRERARGERERSSEGSRGRYRGGRGPRAPERRAPRREIALTQGHRSAERERSAPPDNSNLLERKGLRIQTKGRRNTFMGGAG